MLPGKVILKRMDSRTCILVIFSAHLSWILFRLLFVQAAYESGANYFYRLNDDSEMLDPWAEKFVKTLEVSRRAFITGFLY